MTQALLLYGVAKAAVVLFGFPLAFVEGVRTLPFGARAAIAYGGGFVALTLHAIVLSAAGLQWTIVSLGLPLALSCPLLCWLAARAGKTAVPRQYAVRSWGAWGLMAAAGWLHFAVSVVALRSTSMDYLYFWGPKAVRFSAAGGIDADLLAEPFLMHLRPNYPPLVPIGFSWDTLFTGRLIWRLEMLDSVLWLLAAAVALHAILSASFGARARPGVAFWTVAICASASASYSAGNAEAPLIFYTTLAAAALAAADQRLVLLAAVMFAGCVLTKSEGRVLWIAIVAASLLASSLRRERLQVRELMTLLAVPAAASGFWYGFQLLHRLRLSDDMRQDILSRIDFTRAESVATTMLRYLGEGTWGVGWFVSFAILLICRRSWRAAVLPASASLAVMALYFVYYLHESRPLEIVMWWEVPRISQPSLSLLIVAASIAYGYEGLRATYRQDDETTSHSV